MTDKSAAGSLRACFFVVAMLVTGMFSQAGVYTIDETRQGQEKIGTQHFNFYLPDAVKTVRAVIIVQHGNYKVPGLEAGWAHGFGAAAWDVQWRALADKWDAAVVSPCLEGPNCEVWYDPKNGGWRALNDALATLGSQSAHPEITDAPLCIEGFSCGGDWAGMMLKEQASRIVAAVARSGGDDPGATADGVPVLLSEGGAKDRYKNEKWFNKARARGALVAFARDTDQAHTPADLNVLAIPFLDACMALRLSPIAAGKVSGPLRTVLEAAGWLGDPKTFAVSSEAVFEGDRKASSWLPDEIIARKWSEYANGAGPRGTGWATVTTPPDRAPDEVAACVDGSDVTLTWHAEADLESGIKNFSIYRDGVMIGTLGGTASTSHGGHGFFQWRWDTKWPTQYPVLPPEQWPFPAAFTDKHVADGSHAYQIATVNAEDREGPKSAAITVAVGAEGKALAPTIVSQPRNVHLVDPLRASFTFSAGGAGPFKYQWRKNGVDIPDATGLTYVTPMTTSTDDKQMYGVVVTGPGGSAVSHSATLYVTTGHSLCPILKIARNTADIISASTDDVGEIETGKETVLTYILTNTGTASFDTPISAMVSDSVNCAAAVTTAPTIPLKNGDSTKLAVTVTPSVSSGWSFKVIVDGAQIISSKWTVTAAKK